MSKPRTQKRSRSGAASECPLCHKKLRGAKGLEAHVRDQHPEMLALTLHTYHPSTAHMGDCTICGEHRDHVLHGPVDGRKAVLL